MPKWLQISRDYAATRKRFSIQGRIGEMLSGILPTYQVERNWPGDQLNMWGINGISDVLVPGVLGVDPPLHISASLHNISDAFQREDQKELLVWRIVMILHRPDLIALNALDEKSHVFTPGTGYNPELIRATGPLPGTGVFLPWLQPQRPEHVLHFPTAGHLDVGYNPNLQLTQVGPDFHVGVGPTLMTVQGNSGGNPPTANMHEFGLPGVDTPPYRVQPGRKLTVQSLTPQLAGAPRRIDASFWYSEREYAVGQ